MKGAHEYANLFGTGTYQYGKLFISIGRHARGSTCHVYVLKNDSKVDNIYHTDNSVEVYGVIDGQLGWTESYGWLHHGPWEVDFTRIVEKRRTDLAAQKERQEAAQTAQNRAETDRIKAILSAY